MRKLKIERWTRVKTPKNLKMLSHAQTELDRNCKKKLINSADSVAAALSFSTAGVNHVLELSTQRTGDWQRQGLGLCEKLQVREEKSLKRVGNEVGRAELIDLLSAILF